MNCKGVRAKIKYLCIHLILIIQIIHQVSPTNLLSNSSHLKLMYCSMNEISREIYCRRRLSSREWWPPGNLLRSLIRCPMCSRARGQTRSVWLGLRQREKTSRRSSKVRKNTIITILHYCLITDQSWIDRSAFDESSTVIRGGQDTDIENMLPE